VKSDLEFEKSAQSYVQDLFSTFQDTLQILNISKHQNLVTEARRYQVDSIIRVLQQEQVWDVLVEHKNVAYPSQVAGGILQVQTMQKNRPNTYGILVVPWLSETVMQQCSEAGIGCVGLNGNYRLGFGGFYAISRGASTPKPESKTLQGLFHNKSARVLRWMLRQPEQAWRLQEIANSTGVSLGQIHKITQALLARGWLEKQPQGLYCTHPKS
jgi:hypothetical protein